MQNSQQFNVSSSKIRMQLSSGIGRGVDLKNL